MADKILNINDYRKAEDTGEKDLQQKPSRSGSETDIDNIRIEDPFVFLSAEERAEYLKAHQETILGRDPQSDEEIRKAVPADQENPSKEPDEDIPETPEAPEKENGGLKAFFSFRRDRHQQEDDFYEEDPDDVSEEDEDEPEGCEDDEPEDEDVADDDFEEDGDEPDGTDSDRNSLKHSRKSHGSEDTDEEEIPEDKKKPAPEKLVRVASTITGILILLILLFIVKVRLIDPLLAGRDDSDGTEFATSTVSAGEQVVTTNGLNLRSSPSSSGKDNIVATVSAGTTLTRTGEENGWSEIEYNGQTVYCASKFLQAQK